MVAMACIMVFAGNTSFAKSHEGELMAKGFFAISVITFCSFIIRSVKHIKECLTKPEDPMEEFERTRVQNDNLSPRLISGICPHCGAVIKAPEGMKIYCPSCSKSIRLG